MARVGLMLYTVRDECARDFAGTLQAVAELGYEGVELFDLHGHAPETVRAWLDELGLVACGRHASLHALEHDLSELAEQAPVIGTNRVALSWIEAPTSREESRAFAGRLARIADEATSLGLELGFHNHDGEVRDLEGRSVLDDLLELPVFLELDLGWVWWAGVDPVELLERTRGRVPLVHVKDFRTRGERSFCPVGAGNVGYERVAPAAVEAGVEWLLVEQDMTEGSALDAARQSFEARSSMLVTA
jgi:sugar phosphate isomerase/epimerase